MTHKLIFCIDWLSSLLLPESLQFKEAQFVNPTFISYDFSKQILPQPELFELRQVLAIPKEDIEGRHEYMLSVIKDRVDNADVYEREYFSKYPNYEYSRRKIGSVLMICGNLRRRNIFQVGEGL